MPSRVINSQSIAFICGNGGDCVRVAPAGSSRLHFNKQRAYVRSTFPFVPAKPVANDDANRSSSVCPPAVLCLQTGWIKNTNQQPAFRAAVTKEKERAA